MMIFFFISSLVVLIKIANFTRGDPIKEKVEAKAGQ